MESFIFIPVEAKSRWLYKSLPCKIKVQYAQIRKHGVKYMATYLEIAAEKPRGLNWSVINLAEHDGVQKGDLTNLPTNFLDEEFDGIYSEHFIEHLYKYQGINLFNEAWRIMKPGGTIRTVWPAWEIIEWLVNPHIDLSNNQFVDFYYNKYVLQE